jgi:hypothetical protein
MQAGYKLPPGSENSLNGERVPKRITTPIWTTDELRVAFWQAIREAAPEQWRALAAGESAGLEAWLLQHDLIYQGRPAAWCRALARRQLDLWRTRAEAADGFHPLASPGVKVAHPIRRESCVFELKVWGWRPDLTAGEAYGSVISLSPDDRSSFVGESREQARERIEGVFRAKLAEHLDAVEALLKASGAREKRQAQHVLWLAEWQVAHWNAARIFRTHVGPHPPRVRRGTRRVVSYERVHKALRETAGRLELDLRKGR